VLVVIATLITTLRKGHAAHSDHDDADGQEPLEKSHAFKDAK
jgi:hypothetical protein